MQQWSRTTQRYKYTTFLGIAQMFTKNLNNYIVFFCTKKPAQGINPWTGKYCNKIQIINRSPAIAACFWKLVANAALMRSKRRINAACRVNINNTRFIRSTRTINSRIRPDNPMRRFGNDYHCALILCQIKNQQDHQYNEPKRRCYRWNRVQQYIPQPTAKFATRLPKYGKPAVNEKRNTRTWKPQNTPEKQFSFWSFHNKNIYESNLIFSNRVCKTMYWN